MRKYILTALTSLLLSCSSAEITYHLNAEGERVYTGLEKFIEDYAERYRGKRAAVVTNHSGVNFRLRRNITLFREKGIELVAFFAPEHGIDGYQNVYDTRQYTESNQYNCIVYNLHHLSVHSLRHLLSIADIVIFDIQDMGMRCYTYISSLKMVIDALHRTDTEFIVLDRPNPIGFLGTDGPFLERPFVSRHISAFPSPFLYNMTIGEAARYYRGAYRKQVKLLVVPLENYCREQSYIRTMLPWVPPSPNLPTYESSVVYTAMVFLEGINVSVGRGTAKPFEYIGAPWIDPHALCDRLKNLKLRSFRFRPVYFKPTFSKYRWKKCGGVHLFYVGGRFSPTEMAYRMIAIIREMYPARFRWERYGRMYDIDYLAGTDTFRRALDTGRSFADFRKGIMPGVERFEEKREKFLLY